MIHFDLELTAEERERVATTDPRDWFTKVTFANAPSPIHPEAVKLDANNELKRELLSDWIERVAPGASVLDTFAANGGFSFLAAQAGASSVTGVEFSPGRVEVASLTADILSAHGAAPCALAFEYGDVYDLTRKFTEPFDVSLVLGGLYHIADPPYVLSQVGRLTTRWMVLQTASVLPDRGNVARFTVRSDRTARGLSSVRGGFGVWHFSVECLRQILAHAGFEIVEERRPKRRLRRRFPWWCALARPTTVSAASG